MDNDYLFAKTLEDLRKTISSPNDYELLRSTALVRQLLIDGNRLLDVVNRQRRLRIRFKIADTWNTPYTQLVLSRHPLFYAVLDGLHPSSNLTNDPVVEVTREQFLKHPVAIVGGTEITVYDVVDYGAHVQGGVHVGKNKNEAHEAIEGSHALVVNGFSMNIVQLVPILKVTYDALLPLRMRIKEEKGF